jgi:hypothetical protein
MSANLPAGTSRAAGPRAGAALAAAALGGLALVPAWRGSAVEAPSPAASPAAPVQTSKAASVVYPAPTLALRFDHARHARLGVGCERCHSLAVHSVTAGDNLLPAESACRPCHAIDRTQPDKVAAPGQGAARCDACHPGYHGEAAAGAPLAEPARTVLRPAARKFNHRLHQQRGIGCALCHAGVEGTGERGRSELPAMALCLGCHDGRQATSRCAACHPTLPDGRLRTVLPGGRLTPSGSLRGADAHTAQFRTQHQTAGRDTRYCASCHKQSECLDCHRAGVVRPPDLHPVDYATLHAVDARRNVPNCASCHRNQTFCVGCHQRLGVASDPEGGQPGRQPQNPFGTGTRIKSFHPPNWVRDSGGVVITVPTPASHSFQARRNIRACASCHREQTCLECHSADPARALQVNPHPAGFSGSSSCRALARNARACLKCHMTTPTCD